MPLHDWSDDRGWDSLHLVWQSQLLEWVQPRLPAGYLHQNVHLMLVDLLPRPAGFSFADAIAVNLALEQPPCPAPFAVSYRVGESVPEGTIIAVWRRPLTVGAPLPTLPLALTLTDSVAIDLEYTYNETARRVYLT